MSLRFPWNLFYGLLAISWFSSFTDFIHRHYIQYQLLYAYGYSNEILLYFIQTCQFPLIQSETQAIVPSNIRLQSEKEWKHCPKFIQLYIWIIEQNFWKNFPIFNFTQLPYLACLDKLCWVGVGQPYPHPTKLDKIYGYSRVPYLAEYHFAKYSFTHCSTLFTDGCLIVRAILD